ncbi:hypothetical protein K435DRAFT_860981 [Dendrothele bispora CBS 962.96]|uniref:Uncharacterized protein n=1 Tax=Dendrothele bispora (strain CBS 962.96) TaxID=1314807 RepID=A0A4S8LWJ9_DENBC|nr:hypothetical protein K435DRAFT_860981 [Dendrothele bispora CBS 962.96]
MSGSTKEPSLSPSLAFVVLEEWVLVEAIEGIFYGMTTLMTFSACWLIMRRGLRNSLSRFLIVIALVIMFINSTTAIVVDLIFISKRVQSLSDPEYDPTPVLIKCDVVEGVISRISYLLGDCIVVWRAWIFFDLSERRYFFRGILAICILGTTICAIIDTVVSLKQVLQGNFNQNSVIYVVPLLVTNFVATLFIAYKAWCYRRFIKATLGNTSTSSKLGRILILLVESGAVYCAVWLEFVLGVFGKTDPMTILFFDTILPHVASILPSIVIILTAVQKTQCETILQKTTGPMQFASAPLGTQGDGRNSVEQDKVINIRREDFRENGLEMTQIDKDVAIEV